MENQKQCPFCGKQVAADAHKCLWCGKYFDSGKAEVSLPALPVWPLAKTMSILVIVALVMSLLSTTFSFFDDDSFIIPFGFTLIIEFICWTCITLSIRGYSRKFSFGKNIPYIAYLSAATLAMAASIAEYVVCAIARRGDEEMILTALIIAVVCVIVASVIHIVVALRLKKQDEVEPLKEYGKVTLIYSIILIFGSGIPVIGFAAVIFYSIFVYKMFRKFDQQSKLTKTN